MAVNKQQLTAVPNPRTSSEPRTSGPHQPLGAGAAGPVLTATAEDFVWLANFAEIGLAGITAFAVLDSSIGIQVMVDERLDLDVRNATINAALELLIKNKAKRFALLDNHGKPFGGAA